MRSIPRNWSRSWPYIVHEFDVRPARRGRLFCKVLIFKNGRDLRRFWREGLGHGTSGALGVVDRLVWTRQKINRDGTEGRIRIIQDRRYFCVMGLLVGHLTMNVLTHECAHAGFAYAKRVRRSPWAEIGDLDEELVCYPAGLIAAAIVRRLGRLGLVP